MFLLIRLFSLCMPSVGGAYCGSSSLSLRSSALTTHSSLSHRFKDGWSAVYSCWLVRCESLYSPPPDIQTAVLRHLFSVLLLWKSLPGAPLGREPVEKTLACLKGTLQVPDKLPRLSRLNAGRFWLIPFTPP